MLKFYARIYLLLFLTIFNLNLFTSLKAQNLPNGFNLVKVTNQLTKPTAFTFAADGRIFIAQQNGIVKVIKNNVLLSVPFLQLNVNSIGERGLLGITLDPEFYTNQYMYLYYTLPDGSRNRVSRFKANGDVAEAGSEKVLLNLDSLSNASIHNGGALHFGKDGKLYIAVGDNANFGHSQNVDTYFGKLLRINSDGTVPADNPFTGSAQKSRIWAYGFRNPFTFSVQPKTGRLFVNDVGQKTWEEINDATVGGKNFGWSKAEGPSTNPAFSNPVYYYGQDTIGDGKGCAITGGVFFNPSNTNYPSTYWGKYFFMDYCNQWINMLDLSGTTAVRMPFATNLGGGELSVAVGADGNLYFIQRSTNSLIKIIYTNNTAPAIVSQPESVSVSEGQPASFSVTATGNATLKYQWQKNGLNVAGATSNSYTLSAAKKSDEGSYKVIVTNAYGNVTSNTAQLVVDNFNAAPVAKILTPTENTLYRGGDTIKFSGQGTDAEDGTLTGKAFTWFVDFHHDAHVHDGAPLAVGSTSGSYVVPTSGEVSDNVFYRVLLVVTDSKGAKDTAYRDLYPRKSLLTFTSQPSGLQISLDGKAIVSPFAVTSVEGIERSVATITPQAVGNKILEFDRWLHGGEGDQTIVTPVNDVTYTAVFKESPFSAQTLEAENAVVSGGVITSNHLNYTGNGFVDYKNPSSDYIEWTFNAYTAGNYNIDFRYALNGDTRNLSIKVNGKEVNNALPFTNTGDWNKWSILQLPVTLHAGENKIRATAIGSSGPNMDHIVISPFTLEAEKAKLSGPLVKNTHPGYTGTGFADFINPSGEFIEWTFYVPATANYKVGFRYSFATTATRNMQIMVNGIIANASFPFTSTSSLSTWAYAYITTKLVQGINTIRATAIGSSGPNIDHILLSQEPVSARLAKIQENKPVENDIIVTHPNPATNYVKVKMPNREIGSISMVLCNLQGQVLQAKTFGPNNLEKNEFTLNLTNISKGAYILKIVTATQTVSKVILVE